MTDHNSQAGQASATCRARPLPSPPPAHSLRLSYCHTCSKGTGHTHLGLFTREYAHLSLLGCDTRAHTYTCMCTHVQAHMPLLDWDRHVHTSTHTHTHTQAQTCTRIHTNICPYWTSSPQREGSYFPDTLVPIQGSHRLTR